MCPVMAPLGEVLMKRYVELRGCTARLTVWDASGKILKTIEGPFEKGYNEIQLGQLTVSGILYYQLETPTHVAIRKMVALE